MQFEERTTQWGPQSNEGIVVIIWECLVIMLILIARST